MMSIDSKPPLRAPKARPFLKWVGGKTQLLSDLTNRMPQDYRQYFEPFLGGGALFFCLQPETATLIDINESLINTYQVIQSQVEDLIEDLGKHVYEKEYFYRIRAADRTDAFAQWSDVEKASRLIYLNKCCFNGLYRVNSRGEFNTPFGRYKSPKILDPENLRACHQSLQGVNLKVGHFTSIQPQANDFVYFDPPYAPLSPTSSFTRYSQSDFGEAEQVALRNFCLQLDQRGVKFMLSNSSAPFILDLYQSFTVEFVQASRAINSKGSKRGKIPEVIVTNYKTSCAIPVNPLQGEKPA